MTIVNDSKSTSFASTISLLKSYDNIYWCQEVFQKKVISSFYQRNIIIKLKLLFLEKEKFFVNQLKDKIKYLEFKNLNDAFKNVLKINNQNKFIHKIVIFSPCAASFDSFKNFEDRGLYFNSLIKKYFYG